MPPSPLPLHLTALDLMAGEKWEEAQALLEKGGAEGGNHPLGLFLLGACRCQLGRDAEGIALLERAAILEPDDGKYHFALGKAYLDNRRFIEAEAAFRRATELAPNDANAQAHLGVALKEQARFDEALVHTTKAILLEPDSDKRLVNLGLVQTEQDNLEGAQQSFLQALAQDANNAESHMFLGLAQQIMGQLQEAEVSFRQALGLAQGKSGSREDWLYQFKSNLALNQLLLGNLGEGWDLHTARIDGPNWKEIRRDRDMPAWDGSPLAGRSLLIWREQGLGDEIRAYSCLPDLLDDGGHQGVAVECDPRLESVLKRSFPQLEVVPGQADRNRPFDLQLALSSLPRLYRRTIASFEAASPFLVPDPALLDKWTQRLGALPPGRKIGICWRTGLPGAARMWNISSLADWAPILRQPGAVFVNLQYGDCEAELRDAESRFGIRIHRWADVDLKDDLDDLLALMRGLDLVLTFGTAVNDLAGSVGRPAWLMLRTPHPDMLGTSRYPWYPTCRVFERGWNQPWAETLKQVAAALAPQDVGRNAPCPCGSGRRFKHCCGR
ncbi:MAG: tetratricopeptide repeat protein [Alphaproteobacteria bacterium]|nr:tetratricopeptide repeat protein [Alphaproteobacteria bacterium]